MTWDLVFFFSFLIGHIILDIPASLRVVLCCVIRGAYIRQAAFVARWVWVAGTGTTLNSDHDDLDGQRKYHG